MKSPRTCGGFRILFGQFRAAVLPENLYQANHQRSHAREPSIW